MTAIEIARRLAQLGEKKQAVKAYTLAVHNGCPPEEEFEAAAYILQSGEDYRVAYDAHALARELESDLGIQLLLTREPYFCKKCGQTVTDKHCAHYETDRVEISGTIIRKYISDGCIPDEIMLRREIFEVILGCGQVFIP